MSRAARRMRQDLAAARADISVLRADRLAMLDRLSTIVDESFGPQEVLGVDALLSRLEHLLTERARQHEEVRRELDEALARISALEKVAMDCASQCDHCDPAIRIERLSEALRDLVGSVEKLEPTRLDFTIVRQCVKAALTVLGGQS